MNYKIENVTGFFDCRQYKINTARSSRVMIENGGRITFSVAFTDEELEQHPELKDFAKKSEKSGLNYIGFKIFPKNCKLYTSSAQQIEFPDNKILDGGRFDANIYYTTKYGIGTELNGVYVNAIQIIRRADNPFDEVEDGDDSWLKEVIVEDPFSNTEKEIKNGRKPKIVNKEINKEIDKEVDKEVDKEINDLPF